MSRLLCNLTILVGVFCCAVAQASLGQPVSCPNAAAMPNVNLTRLNGTWFEVARNPNNNWNCVEVDLKNTTTNNVNTLWINVTMATNPNMLNMNISMNGSIVINADSNSNPTAGYNVSYGSGSVIKPNVTLKLLNTDYDNVAYVCGFYNASDNSTFFGAILTRQRVPPVATIQGYEMTAAATYSEFSTNMTLINQSNKCYTQSSATTSVPALASIFTLLFAILKYFN